MKEIHELELRTSVNEKNMSSMQWAISFQLSVTEIMQENDRIGTLGFSEHLSKQKMIELAL
jgi:hypothetical protein